MELKRIKESKRFECKIHKSISVQLSFRLFPRRIRTICKQKCGIKIERATRGSAGNIREAPTTMTGETRGARQKEAEKEDANFPVDDLQPSYKNRTTSTLGVACVLVLPARFIPWLSDDWQRTSPALLLFLSSAVYSRNFPFFHNFIHFSCQRSHGLLFAYGNAASTDCRFLFLGRPNTFQPSCTFRTHPVTSCLNIISN